MPVEACIFHLLKQACLQPVPQSASLWNRGIRILSGLLGLAFETVTQKMWYLSLTVHRSLPYLSLYSLLCFISCFLVISKTIVFDPLLYYTSFYHLALCFDMLSYFIWYDTNSMKLNLDLIISCHTIPYHIVLHRAVWRDFMFL